MTMVWLVLVPPLTEPSTIQLAGGLVTRAPSVTAGWASATGKVVLSEVGALRDWHGPRLQPNRCGVAVPRPDLTLALVGERRSHWCGFPRHSISLPTGQP